MQAYYSCASICDASGNLLFYTNGNIIWDQTNSPMANGTGLMGLTSGLGSSQTVLILKKPGSSTIYYVFNSSYVSTSTNGMLYYNEVDMSLASGNGSVTVKNATLYTTGSPSISISKLTATKHCNGTDIWLVCRDWYWWWSSTTGTTTTTNSFHSFQISSAGIGTTAISSSPTTYTYNNSFGSSYDYGCMKISPAGKKLAVAVSNWNNSTTNQNAFELYDFDNSTGVVSNSLALMTNTTTNWSYSWGVEFSPDGTKLYGSKYYNALGYPPGVFQWDLCAGSGTAIAASIYTVYTSTSPSFGALQLGKDGKIYCARTSQSNLDVINNPNLAGAACNYSVLTQSLSSGTSLYSLPNFMCSYFAQPPAATPFTYTVSNTYGCQAAQFNTSYSLAVPVSSCSSSYSLISFHWDFGEPSSGAANTSTLNTPIHSYASMGTYTVKLVLQYSCGGGKDSVMQTVNINQPCVTVGYSSVTCSHLGSATVTATGGIGPFSFTWMPTGQTNSVATGLAPGIYTLTVFDFGNAYTYTATAPITSSVPLTGNLNYASSVTCNGASTASANVTGIAGGSGAEYYLWTNGTTSLTSPTPSLSAGIWSVTVTDVLTGCQINQSFLITQPPPLSLTLSSSSPTTCAGTSVNLTSLASGGTPNSSTTSPAYAYFWTSGPPTSTRTAGQAMAGTYVYTVTTYDVYNCSLSGTISVDFIPNPTISVSSVSICPLQTGIINASGAGTYTWNTGPTGSSLSDNPLSTQQYTVTGTALGCTSTAVGSIILKPVPVAMITSNSPICNGEDLQLSGFGALSFFWNGPGSFTSSAQYPVIHTAAPGNSGVYSVTLTALNSCTSSAQTTITVNPTPTLSASGSTVCTTQSASLNASSFASASYTWTGPSAFSSTLQNPGISSPSVSNSGGYTVSVVSAQGCTNSAVANVSVTAMPSPSATSNSPKCFGSTLTFSGSGAGSGSYNWTGPNSFVSSLQNPTLTNVTLANGGVYNLQVVLGPCVVNVTHSAVVNPLPSFTPTSNSPVCQKHDLILGCSAIANGSLYIWHGPGTYGAFGALVTRPSVDTNFAGTYTLSVTDLNGCQSSATHLVSIYKNPVLSITSSTVCLNQPATLKVSGATSYYWTGPDFYQSFSPDAIIPSASSSVITVYTVVGTAANQCTNVAYASLNTLPLPEPYLTVAPANKVCINKEVTMTGYGANYYSWEGPGRFKSNGKTLTFNASGDSYIGTYTLWATDEKGCTNYTTTSLALDPLPQGSLLGSIMDACVPFQSDFNFYAGNTIKPSWTFENGIQLNTRSFSRYYKDAGDYIITGLFLDTTTTCQSTYTYVVHARPIPVADFTYSPEIPVEGMEDVFFVNTSSGVEQSKWSWHFINNEGYTSNQKNCSYFFANAGIYPVAMVVSNKWGCSDTIVKAINIEPNFNVYVPNVFTPNGDGNNDTFKPVISGVKMYELLIFDRWGNRLFSTSDQNASWDGTYAGQNCKDDVYVWKIKVSSFSGEMKEMNGHLTVYR